MKLTYPVCCGVDVHKTFLVATIITSEYVMPHYHQKRFSTFYNGLVAFKKWLLEYDCKDVCMESTGKYWVPVWNVLEDSCHVVIANPKWVSAVKGNKDDKKDSKWIGDLFRMGLVPSSYIPSKETRILREFTRYRSKLVSMRSSEKNRFQNAFTVCRSFKGILRILTIVLLSLMRSLAISLPNTKGKSLCSVRFPVSNAERQLPYAGRFEKKADTFFCKRGGQAACFSWPCYCRFNFLGLFSRLVLQPLYLGIP